MNQRGRGAAKHVRPATQGKAQRSLAAFTIFHFQQTCGEIGARHCIIGTQRQRVPVGVGSIGILAVQQQDTSERHPYISAPRRGLLRLQQDLARLAAVIALNVEPGQVQLQINIAGCERKPLHDGGNRLALPSVGG